MNRDCNTNEVKSYLHKTASEFGMESLLQRTTNCLLRGGIDTMEKLCAMDREELYRIRNMGEKSVTFALMARDKYQTDKNKSL